MKRKSTILAAIVLATSIIATPVYAADTAGLDLDSMSVEDLVSLRDTINAKIGEKGGDNVLPQGTYEVGKDIKAGSFKVMCCAGYDMSCFNVYSSKEDHDNMENVVQDSVSYDKGDSAMINLDEGDYLDVTWGSAVVEEVTNASWAPDTTDSTEK